MKTETQSLIRRNSHFGIHSLSEDYLTYISNFVDDRKIFFRILRLVCREADLKVRKSFVKIAGYHLCRLPPKEICRYLEKGILNLHWKFTLMRDLETRKTLLHHLCEHPKHAVGLYIAIDKMKKAEKVVLNRLDWEGQTPLFNALLKGNSIGVYLILEAKADVNFKNLKGQTPLDVLAQCSKTVLPENATLLVGLLLKFKAVCSEMSDKCLTAHGIPKKPIERKTFQKFRLRKLYPIKKEVKNMRNEFNSKYRSKV